jgi:hypothetical protein
MTWKQIIHGKPENLQPRYGQPQGENGHTRLWSTISTRVA